MKGKMKMQNRAKLALLACLMMATSGGTAIAQNDVAKSANGPLAPLSACRQITDPAKRVACYDSEVDKLTAAVQRDDVKVVDKATVKEARRGLFGFNIGKIRLFGDDKEEEKQTKDEKQLTTTIKSARLLPNDRWRFTLDSDAVWETTEPITSTRVPKPGMSVELEKAAMGSYFAKFAGGRAIRARRVD
jgi:hypothetical protein